MELLAYSRKMFAQRYFFRHNCWPPGVYPKYFMKKYVSRSQWVSDEDNRILGLDEWAKIRFTKVFNYDYFVDTTEILKDSAMSPDYNAWWTMYDRCAFNILHGHEPKLIPDNIERRVMMRYLKGEENECRKAVEDAQINATDPSNYICEVCLKEGELNSTGRGFIKQTYEQRLVQVSMESNLAKSLLPYFDEQTMTSSELERLMKTASATRVMGEFVTNTNLDLAKWNITFRNELVRPFGELLDELFGTGELYTNSHDWFEKTVALSNDRMCPPNFDTVKDPITGVTYYIPHEGPYSHLNHLGGFEGMHQKKWTFITIMVILFVAETLSLKVKVIGQGDNQVMFTRYTEQQKSDIKILQERSLNMLAGNFAKIGLKLKPTETWYSRRLFEYGRERILEGMTVPSGLKRATKLVSDINDGYSSWQTYLTTIETVTESIARKDFFPDPAFLLYGFNVTNYLFRRGTIQHSTSINKVVALLNYPICLGGLTVGTYMSHLIRGVDDKLTLVTGGLAYIGSSCVNILKLQTNCNILSSIHQQRRFHGNNSGHY